LASEGAEGEEEELSLLDLEEEEGTLLDSEEEDNLHLDLEEEEISREAIEEDIVIMFKKDRLKLEVITQEEEAEVEASQLTDLNSTMLNLEMIIPIPVTIIKCSLTIKNNSLVYIL
jgi:hypothetical protein